jgi:nucleotide-binding universal stress UspA family protein
MTKVIISYDGTENDHDALALGRAFGQIGAELSLAYVRHTRESGGRSEELAQHDAEALLARGASWLGQPDARRHVVLSGSTGEGLSRLADQEGADIIVLGSDYRTAAGHIQMGNSALHLLNNGPSAIALAPARLRDRGELGFVRVAVNPQADDDSAELTARSIAERGHGTVVRTQDGGADLIVLGSKAGAQAGRVLSSGSAEYLIETTTAPVIVVPRGRAIVFADVAPAAPVSPAPPIAVA